MSKDANKIFEDENIIVLNKPAGIESEKLAAEFLLAHRLDKATSGVLVLAKNKQTQEFLRAQFKERKTDIIVATSVIE
ncbi:MAG: pseudouridine synthase, partial [Patescibacteria group bacterium]